jgi:peptide/nickel transport system permease protein
MMRIADLVLTLPFLAVAAVLGHNVGGSWWLIAVVIGGLYWAYVARVARGVVLSLREKEFVEAARAIGASDARIIFRHLMPNAFGSIIVNATVLVSLAILLETALSYLGFGVRPPDTSLGLLVSEAQTAVETRPWLFFFPGLFIILIALTINFIGDGLRDALDPQQTRVRR